jgi:hypothetical protein
VGAVGRSDIFRSLKSAQLRGALAYRSDLPKCRLATPDTRDFRPKSFEIGTGNSFAPLILPEHSMPSCSARLLLSRREMRRYHNHLEAFLRKMNSSAYNCAPGFARQDMRESKLLFGRRVTVSQSQWESSRWRRLLLRLSAESHFIRDELRL